MSNHLVPSSSTSVQTAFNWDETVAETKALVKEDAELTATIDDAMVKRFQGRVQIGLNLMALQDAHSRKGGGAGDFTTKVLPDLGIDTRFAQRCISVARLFQSQDLNATSLSRSNLFDIPLPMDTWYKLASPAGQTIISQIEEGEIEPTSTAIKAEIKAAKERAEAAEQQAKEAQQQLDLFKQRAEQEKSLIVTKTQQELELKNQMLDVISREKQLRDQEYAQLEVEKEQIAQSKVQVLQEDTPETKAKLAKIEQEHKNLEAQQKTLQEERDEFNAQLKLATKYVDELSNEIESYNHDNQIKVHNKEIRFKWQQACDAFHLGITQGMARMVTQYDAQQAFEGDDWARLADLEATLQRTLKSLSGLRRHTTIDASMDYVEA